MVRARAGLIRQAQETALEDPFEAVAFAYGIPMEPPAAETPGPCPDFVYEWGDPAVPWRGRLYLDGGGFGLDAPEIGRCSWAVVQLQSDGKPCKALFGTLPGLQMIGRAERDAGLVALGLF